MALKIFTIVLLVMPICLQMVAGENILESMRGKTLSRFNELIVNSPVASQYVNMELTIFAPSDEAMEKYRGEINDNFILNHMVNFEVLVGGQNQIGRVTRVGSMMAASPPLWITKEANDFFVNGAKIIMRNLKATSDIGKRKQALHVIDEVIEPLQPVEKSSSTAYMGLTAGKLLRQPDTYNLDGHTIKNFTMQVREENLFQLFDHPGTHTFFIPADIAFASLSRELVDENVIPGHIVPDQLLFTKPIFVLERKTATYSSKSEIKVTAIVQNGKSGAEVKSNTVQGNRQHNRENVIARILKANIPVSNGIVHIIEKPLVIIASTLWDYLRQEEEQGGRLSKFARYVRSYASPELKDYLKQTKPGTLFAPTNEAFDALPVSEMEKLFRDPVKSQLLLGLHYVDQRIGADDIRIRQPQNDEQMFGVRVPLPAESNNKVWFYHADDEKTTLMVDGLGVAAEVTEEDVGATNGVIHVIDKVLGIPVQSVHDKLSQDPMLSDFFSLGEQDHFNDAFQDLDRNFTLIVPSNQAWQQMKHNFASTYKIIFLGTFPYHSEAILERHLIKDEAYNTGDLTNMTKAKGGVTMLRGTAPFMFSEADDGEYVTVEWEDLTARVIRPNLKCTNGYIHVIDKVMLKPRDVTLSGGQSLTTASTSLTVLLTTLTMCFIGLTP